MDFQSAMETFAEAWVAANAGQQTQALALTRPKSPPLLKKERSLSPQSSREPERNTQEASSPRYGQSGTSPPSNDLMNSGQGQNPPISAPSLAATPKRSTPTSLTENGLPPGSIPAEKILPSPSLDRKDFDFSKVNAKSLPLHCIVESVPSLQASLTIDSRNPWKRRPNIETDSYVIVAASTPWSEIVSTALQRLGYSMDIACTARGSLIIKNWKPIPLEHISDSPGVPVCDILGELTSIVTLRIVILRTKPSTFAEVKDKLLKLLVLQSHAVLRSTGCPLDEVLLSQICRSSYQNTFPFTGEISEEIRRKFDQWWTTQLSPHSPMAPKILPFIAPQQSDIDYTTTHPLHTARETLLENHHPPPHPNMMVHPALHSMHSQYPSQKTRMRTSFDPEMELPKLQRWFQENPHPSRQQIQSYVIQLNSLESRRGRKPLDVNNVVYWFKNARAAQKRAEMRGQTLGNGYVNHQQQGLLMSHSDYMKSPHSMKSEDIDNLSQHSEDMEEDSSRPSSPQLPLSLTTHERNRSIEDGIAKDEIGCNGSGVERNNNSSSNNNNENLPNGRESNSELDHNQIDENSNNQNSEHRSTSPKNSPKSEDLDMDDNDISQMDGFRTPSPDPRRDLSFPMVPNSMFSHSIMYMSHYMPGMGQPGHGHHPPAPMTSGGMGNGGINLSSLSSEERRKRNRTFIDPVTEVPKLEQWFAMNTHPSHNLILKYTEDLNRMPYRQKFPRLESKNVQFWFKNRRAKCKRLKMSLYDAPQCPQLGMNSFGHAPKFEDRE